MPRYYTPTPQRPTRTKAYNFQCNALSADATSISQTFQLSSAQLLKEVKIHSVTYPHEAQAIRINDQKSVLFADGGGTVPYTVAHSFAGAAADSAFSITAWIKTPALCAAEFPIIELPNQYYLSLSAAQELSLLVKTDADNYIGLTTVGTVTNEVWTAVCCTYDGSGVAGGIKLYIDGVNDAGVTAGAGAHTGMVDGSVATTVGVNAALVYANGHFGDLVIWNVVLDQYQVTTMCGGPTVKNVQTSPWVVSWYTFGDSDTDSVTVCTDVVGGHNMAMTDATVEVEAPGGGTGDNVAAADHTGTLLIQVYNVSELRSYCQVSGSNFGQAFSVDTTWSCPFISGTEGVFEKYWDVSEGSEIALTTPTQVSAIQLKITYLGSEISALGATVLPIVSHPGHVNVKISLVTEI